MLIDGIRLGITRFTLFKDGSQLVIEVRQWSASMKRHHTRARRSSSPQNVTIKAAYNCRDKEIQPHRC